MLPGSSPWERGGARTWNRGNPPWGVGRGKVRQAETPTGSGLTAGFGPDLSQDMETASHVVVHPTLAKKKLKLQHLESIIGTVPFK